MKIYISIILVFLQLFGHLNSINVDCNFNSNWEYMILGNIYRCEVENDLNINSKEESAITSVTGYHSGSRANDDVVGFDSRQRSMQYFPQRLDKFFGNLKSIVIYYGRIKEIHQSDLKPFTKLVNFYLDNNDIETLEAGLFDFNPNLKGVSFLGNKLTKIETTIFDNLSMLQNIWLSQNLCISMDATNSPTAARNVIKQAESQCLGKVTEQETKVCADRCDFQNESVESMRSALTVIQEKIGDLHASFDENNSAVGGKCQINFNEKLENLEEHLESFENKTESKLERIEKEFEAIKIKILTSVDEKMNAVEKRLVEKMEQVLEEKLGKIIKALNVEN